MRGAGRNIPRTPPIRMVSRWIAQAALQSGVRGPSPYPAKAADNTFRSAEHAAGRSSFRQPQADDPRPLRWPAKLGERNSTPLQPGRHEPCQTTFYVLNATAREPSRAVFAMAMEKVLLQASQPAPAGNAMELADAAATFAAAAAKSSKRIQK